MDQEQETGSPEGAAVSTPLADIVGKRQQAAPQPSAGQQTEAPPPPSPDKGDKPEAPKPEAAPPRAEDGKFAPKEPPPPGDDEAKAVPVAALKDERAKRQAAEAARQKAEESTSRLAEQMEALRREIATMRQPPQQPAPPTQPAMPEAPPPDFWTDPDAYFTHRLREQEQTIRHDMVMRHLGTSEAYARARYQDFDAALKEFAETIRHNPALNAQMVNAPDPGEFAYRVGKRALETKPILTDPEGWKRQAEAEIRARLEAEYADRIAAQEAVSAPVETVAHPQLRLPTSLAAVRSVAARSGPQWTGPQPLDNIIGPRARSAARPK